jgi:F0F1-type ATP synthase membrane subunit b/b'
MLETDSTAAQSEGIYEVLQSLDQATKDFARRLDELAAVGGTLPAHDGAAARPGIVEAAPGAFEPASPIDRAPRAAAPATPAAPPDVEPYPSLGLARAHLELDRRMADAEAEAQRYLEEAKQRADSMVQSIVNAVESEADTMRRDAEEGIRRRWVEVEAEAERFLADARRASDGIVENRQRRIAELSDTIVGVAGELTERMTDAAQMQRQFDALVVSLSDAAGRIATDPETNGRAPSDAADAHRRGSWRARVEAAEATEAHAL